MEDEDRLERSSAIAGANGDAPAEVLFLHPYNHTIADVLPVGAIALVNMLRHRGVGRYAEEVLDEEIAAA